MSRNATKIIMIRTSMLYQGHPSYINSYLYLLKKILTQTENDK